MSRLAGAPAMSGFRAAADKAAPELRHARDLRYMLLDDVPVATLISGHALSASNLLGDVAKSGYLPVADQCAGFAIRRAAADVVRGGRSRDRHRAGGSRPRSRRRPLGLAPRGGVAAPRHAPQTPHRCLRETAPGESASTRCSVTPTCEATAWRRSSTSTRLAAVVDTDSGVIVESRRHTSGAAVAGVPGGRRQRGANRRNDVAGTCTSGSDRNCPAPAPAPISTICCAASPMPRR